MNQARKRKDFTHSQVQAHTRPASNLMLNSHTGSEREREEGEEEEEDSEISSSPQSFIISIW